MNVAANYKIIDPAACFLLGFVAQNEIVTVTKIGEFGDTEAGYFVKGGFLYFITDDDVADGYVEHERED